MKNEQNQTILAGKVPAGYQQTEVGIIPEDWEVVYFDSILEKFQNGYAFSASKYAVTGIPIITMSQIGLSGKFQFDSHNVNYWDSASSSDLKDFEVHYGDLLIAMTDVTPDKNLIGQMTISSYNDTALLNQRVGLIRCNPDLIQKQFLFYLSSMPIWKRYCKNVASLGVQANIGVKDIKRAKIVLPPLKEQTAIAEALSDVDSLLVSLEKLIEKKRAIKTGTMQQLLTGKKRLPAFAQQEDGTLKGYKTTELGEIPEDWEVKSIIQICDVLTGYPFPSAKFSDSGVKLLRGSNVKRNALDWADEILMYWPTSIGLSDYELKSGDIVIAMDGSLVGRSFAQISSNDLPCLLVQRVARLRSKSVDLNYIKEWVCSIFFTNYCDSVKTVTAIPHISPKDIQEYKVLVPKNIQEQTAIAEILSDMDAEIEALEAKRAKTEEIKQGMMQELLTGRTRLI